jgi:hypothetical protein
VISTARPSNEGDRGPSQTAIVGSVFGFGFFFAFSEHLQCVPVDVDSRKTHSSFFWTATMMTGLSYIKSKRAKKKTFILKKDSKEKMDAYLDNV